MAIPFLRFITAIGTILDRDIERGLELHDKVVGVKTGIQEASE